MCTSFIKLQVNYIYDIPNYFEIKKYKQKKVRGIRPLE